MSGERDKCAVCGRTLTADEVGLYRRLICRSAESGFLCLTCLAARFSCGEDLLRDKIKKFREAGCTLFIS